MVVGGETWTALLGESALSALLVKVARALNGNEEQTCNASVVTYHGREDVINNDKNAHCTLGVFAGSKEVKNRKPKYAFERDETVLRIGSKLYFKSQLTMIWSNPQLGENRTASSQCGSERRGNKQPLGKDQTV